MREVLMTSVSLYRSPAPIQYELQLTICFVAINMAEAVFCMFSVRQT